jgi:hypothetical protein
MDYLCSPFLFGLHQPFHGYGMILRGIAANYQCAIGILQVNYMVGHNTPAK